MERLYVLKTTYGGNYYHHIAFTDYDKAIEECEKLNKPVNFYHIIHVTMPFIDDIVYFITVGFGEDINKTKVYGVGTKIYPSEYHAKSNVDWYNEDDYEPDQVIKLDENNICFKDTDGCYKYTIHPIRVNKDKKEM